LFVGLLLNGVILSKLARQKAFRRKKREQLQILRLEILPFTCLRGRKEKGMFLDQMEALIRKLRVRQTN